MDTLVFLDKLKNQIDKVILSLDPAYSTDNESGMVDGIYDLDTILARLRKAMSYIEKLEEITYEGECSEIEDDDDLD